MPPVSVTSQARKWLDAVPLVAAAEVVVVPLVPLVVLLAVVEVPLVPDEPELELDPQAVTPRASAPTTPSTATGRDRLKRRADIPASFLSAT
jgi:hypothetical protein